MRGNTFMKKKIKLFSCGLLFATALVIGTFSIVRSTSTRAAKADGEWSEELSTKQLSQAYRYGYRTTSNKDYNTDPNNRYSVGVRHGNLAEGEIEKFPFSDGWGANFGVSSSNGADFYFGNGTPKGKSAGDNVDVENKDTTKTRTVGQADCWSIDNVGVIMFIEAKVEMTIKVAPLDISGSSGWMRANTEVNYYRHLAGEGATTFHLVSQEIYTTGGKPTAFAGLAPVNLGVGDTLYFEFIFRGSDGDPSNIQGARPVFALSNQDTSISTFIDTYMHMDDYTENLGYCLNGSSQHYYSSAKEAFNALSDGSRELFCTGYDYKDAYARLVAWANANSDTLETVTYTIPAQMNNIQKQSHESLIIVGVASISLLVVICFIAIRKRQVEK